MRVLGIGEYCNLGDLYWRLSQAGHEVRVYVADPAAHGIFKGAVERVAHWSDHLPWIRAAGREGVIVFESALRGDLQDRLRDEGYAVIGGSAYGDRLENDRPFGQELLRRAGLPVAPTYPFTSFQDAREFLRRHPGRYVFKLNDSDAASTRNYVGELADGTDLDAVLAREQAQWQAPRAPSFVLMQHVAGIEVGVGAYFDGHDFLAPALLDFEHKRFFTGEQGELTGEMGTVVSYRGAERLFARTLAPLRAALERGRYLGYINLNTIVSGEAIHPLEFTCRFGYPGFAICDALHAEGWDSIFRRMLGGAGELPTHPGYAVGVVLTLPPFPYENVRGVSAAGVPVRFAPGSGAAQRAQLHFGEMARRGEEWIATGPSGYLMVATGRGPDVRAAQQAAYAAAAQVRAPNLRYRPDIGDRVWQSDLERLRRWGWLPTAPESRAQAATASSSVLASVSTPSSAR